MTTHSAPLYLSPAELARDLAIRDLSDPAQSPHAMQSLLADVTHTLTESWQVPAHELRLSPLVSVRDNYDRLGFGTTAVTRDQRYSRYLSPSVMLRSHTSASIPGALDQLHGREHVDELLVAPGLVYRRDAIDRTHVGAPHQVDLWRVADRPSLDIHHLEEMIALLVDAVLPGAQWRTVPAVHPYTTRGLQVDVAVGSDWLELAECGLIAPTILGGSSLEPARWSGLALGMGLDRALMVRKGIDDIRLLRSTDPRIAEQMLDLEPWRAVSVLPAIGRDISVVLNGDHDAETIGDLVREALGERVEDLERVELLAVTSWAQLHPRARERMQMRPDQVNGLIRITLRPLTTTLTNAEANELRDAIYRAVHRGAVLELIGEPVNSAYTTLKAGLR
jgi:phenylalanyl-tRNA synthetase alpha chain